MAIPSKKLFANPPATIVPVTLFVVVFIMLIVPSPAFVTYAYAPVGETATASGPWPAMTVLTNLFVVPSIMLELPLNCLPR